MNIRLGGTGSDRLGVVRLYGSALRASLLALVGRGDEGMFERMARLIRPARRQAAILFADLQASGALARRLSSASYFSLMRGLTTAIDDVVIEHDGIVGKHAGDGVTAFFLEEDAGSVSAAAAAAVEAGRRIAQVTETAAGDVEGAVFNVGLHWGGTLYIGQVVTGGRIEVTALGDEVNEAARIQQVARDGAILASKPLLERLGEQDAQRLGLSLDDLTYETLGELPGASEKALRDAGAIAVTDVRSV
jgi:class 3 adenylate cyclase